MQQFIFITVNSKPLNFSCLPFGLQTVLFQFLKVAEPSQLKVNFIKVVVFVVRITIVTFVKKLNLLKIVKVSEIHILALLYKVSGLEINWNFLMFRVR